MDYTLIWKGQQETLDSLTCLDHCKNTELICFLYALKFRKMAMHSILWNFKIWKMHRLQMLYRKPITVTINLKL